MTREEAIKKSDKLCTDIYTLSRQINQKNTYLVFFNDSPHVNHLWIEVKSAPWTEFGKAFYKEHPYYIDPATTEEAYDPIRAARVLRKLRQVRMILKQFVTK